MTYKSILCLNGDLPEREFFDQLSLPIIAADGAAEKLLALGIRPSIVIGDLDSVDPHLDLTFLQVVDQDRSDYEKCMAYLDENGLLPTIVLGSSGGELDHILNNVSIFMTHSRGGYPGNLLYAPPIYGAILDQSQIRITVSIDTKISLLGLPQARLETHGLEWDLTGQTLCFPGFNSILNRAKENQVLIKVLEGKVLFLAHGYFSQEVIPFLIHPSLSK